MTYRPATFTNFRPHPKSEPKPKKVQKPLKRVALKKKFKPTGELELFKQVWSERKHECEWCGVYIHNFNINLFDHIIEKSKAPQLRLEKTNIRILCERGHYLRHFGSKEQIAQHIKLKEANK